VSLSQLSWMPSYAFADNCNVPSNWTDSSVRSYYILMVRSSSTSLSSHHLVEIGSTWNFWGIFNCFWYCMAVATPIRLFATVKWRESHYFGKRKYQLKSGYSGALAQVSRPIQLDICIWGQADVWTWGARVVCEPLRIFMNLRTEGIHLGTFLEDAGRC